VSMVLTGGSFMALRLTIGRHLRETGRLEHEDSAAERKHWTSLAMYLVAIALSFRHPQAALGMVVLVMLLWIVPTAKLKPLEDCVEVHRSKQDDSSEGIRRLQ
jgi:hypothetical protein